MGFVGDHLVFGVIDEIDRREIIIPPTPVASTSKPVPSTPSPKKPKSSSSKSKSTSSSKNASPSKKNDQSTLHAFFSPSPTKPKLSSNLDKGKAKAVEPETSFRSDDAFMDLTSDDDAADLAALAEIEALERIRCEPEKQPEKKTRWGYVISDTKTRLVHTLSHSLFLTQPALANKATKFDYRFNRSLPPESDTLSSRLQLMLYHRLFTSLLQPEPPPPLNSPPPSSEILSTGPFPWSKLYEKFSLLPSAPLPSSFLTAIEPIIVGSELEELLGGVKTLGGFVNALGRVGGRLSRREGEVLEETCEIIYVLREGEDKGGAWKGRRSAQKKKKGKEKEKEDELDLDEQADLEAAIKLSLQIGSEAVKGKDPEGLVDLELANATEAEEDSQLPFLANPSLPLPFDLPPPPPATSQQSEDGSGVEEDGPVPVFSLPTNSQANQQDEDFPKPAVATKSRSNGRDYNLRRRKPNPSSLTRIEPPRSVSPPRPETSSIPLPVSSPSSPTSPALIGTSRFPLQLPLLSSHLSRTLSYWTGEREPIGVSIDQVKRCRTCEFEEGCEWRAGKAREMEERGRERKRAREVEEEISRTGNKRKSVEVEVEAEE